jgi:hypothetical protein
MLALTYTLITPTQGGNILRCPLAHFYSAVDRHDIDDLHPDQIATAQLAVDGQVKERQVAMVLGQLKPNPDRPDMFGLKRSFLADDPAFVPGWTQCANGG